MGVTVNPNIGVYKVVKFIKVPDRRLFSGLLYINVINHEINDDKDDFIQHMHNATTVPDSIGDSNMFTDPPEFHDRGRTAMRHSFADYDCFIFSVCGGMSLTGGITSPIGLTTYRGDASLGANNLLVLNDYANYDNGNYFWRKSDGSNGTAFSGSDNTTLWYKDSGAGDPFGDSCCHFVKYHLLSRINNGSGHAQNTTGNEFYKHRPTLRKTWTQNIDGDINSSNPAVVGDNDEWILSHGTYDTKEVDGTALTKMELAVRAEGWDQGEYYKMDNDAVADQGHTYFAPVDKIAIYGTHHVRSTFHDQSGNNPDRIWSADVGTNAVHINDFWSLVVEIGLRGNNPSGDSSHDPPDKALINSNILVSFHPFGETAAFVVSDTKHTS